MRPRHTYSKFIQRKRFMIPKSILKRKSKEEGFTFPEKSSVGGFPGGAVVENLPANAGDTGSSPGLGRSHMPRSN